MDRPDSDRKIKDGQAYGIETLPPEKVVFAVRAGIGHRLNNAITPVAYLQLIEDQRAIDLCEKIMLVKSLPGDLGKSNLEEIAGGAIPGEKGSLTETARKGCRFYIDLFANKMREKGFGGEDSEEVVGLWQKHVDDQFNNIRTVIGDNEDLDSAEQSWRGASEIINDLVEVALGRVDVPPIYDYEKGNLFVDFGRKGSV